MNDPASSISSQENPFTQATQQEGVLTRPTGVGVTGVLCILGGILGILASLTIVVQLVFGQQMASAMAPVGPDGDAQRAVLNEIEAITAKYMIPNVAIGIAVLSLGTCLVVGGVALFMPKLWAPAFLRKVLVVLIVVEVLRQIVYVIGQIDMSPVMQRHMEVVANSAGGAAGGAEMMKSMQKVGMIVGLVFGICWFAVKIGLMIWGRSYLNRPHVKEYFERAT